MFNRVIVAVVGSSNSGKTTAVEYIVKGLTEKGYTVASAKRIPEHNFTLDTEGKDTYRQAKAGAQTVLSVAPNELGIIRKVNTKKLSLEQIISEIPEETDVIILEGFKSLVGEDLSIPKIVGIKTPDDMTESLKRYKNILAFINHKAEQTVETEYPVIDPMKDPKKLVDLVTNTVAVQVERKHKREQKITIQIEDEIVPLGDFVQDIVRNSVIAMVSSLKGAKIKGEEKVSIVIKRLKRG
ncbi:MAG: molybdopterin-guanine dinucleotide biosynthesis protein B [Candidatus Bathyarchaeum sp.]|nr:MAG: molybdopterin-guanine dinucleotide biosynthesis protein B [Candidatus Bathyarchaeum sp.]